MSNKELSIKIMEIRNHNESNKEQILEDKVESLEDLKVELHKELQNMASDFDENPDIKMIWDSEYEIFYAKKDEIIS